MNTTGHSQPGSSSLDEPANAAALVNGLGLPVAQLVARRPEEADVSVIPFAVGQRRQCISLRRVDGLVEIVEVPAHPWFVATQFHPEFTSTPRDGHPLFTGFIKAARAARAAKLPRAVAS